MVTVLVDQPRNPAPTLLTFAGVGALFFGIVFAVALWQLRGRAPGGPKAVFWRRVARAYLVLGIVVTALGFVAMAQAALGLGSPAVTLWVVAGITIVWAAFVPLLLRRAADDTAEAERGQ